MRQRAKPKHAAVICALAAICVFLVGEAAIPGTVGACLERAIAGAAGGVESVQVYVRTFPALAVAFGRADLLRIDARNLTIGGLRVQRLFLDARQVNLDVGAVLRGGKVGLRRIGKGDVTVILAEEDLSSYLRSKDGLMKALSVRLRPGVAAVAGAVSLLGVKVDLVLEGTFAIEGGTRLRYAVDRFKVGNMVVPKVVKDEIMRRVDLSVDVSGLPIPLVLRDISVQDGVVYVFGETP